MEYALFKYLWLAIILPKIIQFIIFAGLLLLLLRKRNFKVKVDKIVKCVLLYVALHLFSIIFNMPEAQSGYRVMAAFNTAFIWGIAALYYAYYKENPISMGLMCKCMFTNALILIALSMLTLALNFYGFESFKLFNMPLYVGDWLMGVRSYRLVAFMDFSNLVCLFYFLVFPFAYHYILRYSTRMKPPFPQIFLMLALVPVMLSHSRLGIALAFLATGFIMAYKAKRLAATVIVGLTVLYMILLLNDASEAEALFDLAASFINGRQSSTDTRFELYEASLRMTMQESPIFGMGIKNMLRAAPLGSHCTYIGIFYKTGVLGALLISYVFYALISQMLRVYRCMENPHLFAAYFIAFFLALSTEDLDGDNWLIILFFSMTAILLSRISSTLKQHKLTSKQLEDCPRILAVCYDVEDCEA
ncbi:MAG: O-antigen ligase family protein [Clostridiales bacterium]|nr:O-antigen ligase family protein [Clostridiales bacterium]